MRLLSFVSLLAVSCVAVAQTSHVNDIECQEAILRAEKVFDPNIYSQCGFDDPNEAMVDWAVWAEQNHAARAMYEICLRHEGQIGSDEICHKALKMGSGAALVRQGDYFYAHQQYPEALQNYSTALKNPNLDAVTKGTVAQNLGILYLDPNSPYYNPDKGIPLMKKAAEQRGALANNILGVYSLFGLESVPVNEVKSFEYLWRGVLLGCPSAEENLGLYHLFHDKKITRDVALQEMKKNLFHCRGTVQSINDTEKPQAQITDQPDCDCAAVRERADMIMKYNYRLVSSATTQAVLQDKTGRTYTVSTGTLLPDGSHVTEIRPSAVILFNGNERQILNLAPSEKCMKFCHSQQNRIHKTNTKIKPYRLTFTTQECSNILYYADKLVDTRLPFTGKKECGYSTDLDQASNLLLKE